MKINIRVDNTQKITTNQLYRILNDKIVTEIGKEYGVPYDRARIFLMQETEGRQLICDYLAEKYDLTVKLWQWGDDRTGYGLGFDFTEDAALTKFLLQHSNLKAR